MAGRDPHEHQRQPLVAWIQRTIHIALQLAEWFGDRSFETYSREVLPLRLHWENLAIVP